MTEKIKIVNDCALAALRKMASNSVDCIITSPPYWGLRDYGIEETDWPACFYIPMPGLEPIHVPAERSCLGLEKTLHAFLGHIHLIFEEARRVLKPRGSCWVNMGDSYAGSWGSQGRESNNGLGVQTMHARQVAAAARKKSKTGSLNQYPGLKPKDLIGQPWRVAFALQAAGWYLRMDNIWNKPNPMPEPVRDRSTKAHEYVFHFTKSENYFFDFQAWREPVNGTAHARRAYKKPDGWASHEGGHGSFHKSGREKGKPGVPPKSAAPGSGIKSNSSFQAAVVDLVELRNKRSVWTVGTVAYSEAHYATYPPALITPPMLATTSAKGNCSACGNPWERTDDAANPWKATCKCDASIVPATVLDFFGGSGTTAEVAIEHGRHGFLVERGAHNIKLIKKRLARVLNSPLLNLTT